MNLHLFGSVGFSFWGEDCFTSKDVNDWLAAQSGDITIRLNSGGGDAVEGQAIHAALVRYPGKVTVVVDGCAASAASLIAMAGDEIVMSLGSWMLIHDPATPYTEGRGTTDDHARLSQHLDAIADGYAAIYAERSGNSVAVCRELMRKETLLTADAAVQMGFASRIETGAVAKPVAAFDYRIYANVPKAARDAADRLGAFKGKQAVLAMIAAKVSATHKENFPMNLRVSPADPAKNEGGGAPKIVMTAGQVTKVYNSAQVAGMSHASATALIEGGQTIEMALDAITAFWKDKGDVDKPMHGPATVHMGRDWNDPRAISNRISDAIAAKICARSGMKFEPTLGRDFMDHTLIDMMGLQLKARGIQARNPADIVQMAASHTNSDFAIAVGGALTSVLRRMGESAPVAIAQCANTMESDDYRTGNAVSLSGSGVPAKVNEAGEIRYTTVNDEGEVKAAPEDFAQIFRVSNQLLTNDGAALGLFDQITRTMGKGAAELQRNTLIAPLIANAGGGQTMRDAQPLFHATHGNLAGLGALLSVATLSAARTAMRRQKDSNGTILNIEPRYILVPPEQETVAQQVVATITAATPANVNPFAGRLEVVAEPGLTNATAWYVVGNPEQIDGLVMAYLSGQEGPIVDSQAGWGSLGMEFRLRWAIGAAFHAYHGWYRNPGA